MSDTANHRIQIDEAKEEKVYKVYGVWDYFEQYFQYQPCQIKIINLKSNSELSFHNNDNQCKLWKVLSGELSLILSDIKIDAVKGDEFYVEELTEYQILTTAKSANLLEISIETGGLEDVVIEK